MDTSAANAGDNFPFIFLCNTPYHAALAWSIAQAQGVLEQSTFVLYKADTIGEVISNVLKDHATVITANTAIELFRYVPVLRAQPGRVAVGNDYNLINQLFIRMLCDHHEVFEDGMAAYISRPYQSTGIARMAKDFLHFLFPNIVFNISGNNASSAARYYALRPDAFLFLDDVMPDIINLDPLFGSLLIQKYGIDPKTTSEGDILFIAQPYSETRGCKSFDKEKTIYDACINKFKGRRIIYKPHPREAENFRLHRVGYFKKICGHVDIMPGEIPLELLCHLLKQNIVVVGIDSSSMLTMKINYGFNNVYYCPDVVDNPNQSRLEKAGISRINNIM